MRRKLKDHQGETLVELLASIVIGTLSVVLLFGAVMASGNMNRTMQTTDQDFYECLNRAERQGDGDSYTPSGSPQVTVAYGSTTKDIPVRFYGGEEAVSFALPPEGAAP